MGSARRLQPRRRGWAGGVRVGNRRLRPGDRRFPRHGAEQAEKAIDTIAWALGEAGGTLLDIVRVRVFVPDRADVEAVSQVVARRIGPARAANTTICAPLPVDEAKVEIEVEARLKG